MAFKEWFQKLRPMQLYIMLVLTGLFFTAELIISHLTHSLTLLVDSYHMLCNMIALTGCIITIKKLHPENEDQHLETSRENQTKNINGGPIMEVKLSKDRHDQSTQSIHQCERSLKNTFGWARIDILVMLIGCIFLASLCFSLLVEAVQTLIHIDHQDEMHYPIIVLVVAAVGLLLNGFCYLLIGGYTFHQGSYLQVTASGEVVLERAVTVDSVRKGQRRLSSQSRRAAPPPASSPSLRQGPREMIRDIIGCIFVVICASVVYFTSGLHFAKYLDPVISIVSAISLLVLSYPYMKESGLILLQTIPDDINIDSLRVQLLQAFPDIVNVHDLHVWQFTADKVISTAHIIFLNPRDYSRINKQVIEFFYEQGITQVTIQAEFIPDKEKNNRDGLEILHKSHDKPCLMPCLTEECRRRHCCARKEDIKREVLESVKVEEIIRKTTKAKDGEDSPNKSEENLDTKKTITVDCNL